MLSTLQRKQASVIAKYCISEFTEAQWYELGQLTGSLDAINAHPRLFRSLSFGDPDYDSCVFEVIDSIVTSNIENVVLIVDHFDIDLWYKSKEPLKYERVFTSIKQLDAEFWSDTKVRVFFSHLAQNKKNVGTLSRALKTWGAETFVAHDDIEPSLEWLNEIEKALHTMDSLVAVVEEGFIHSKWCDQEVGFAFGRGIDVFPLRNGADPYGFMGKIQGLPVKGRYPNEIATDLIKLMLKKQRLYSKTIKGIQSTISTLPEKDKILRVKLIYGWGIITNEDMKLLLESAALEKESKEKISDISIKVGAFVVPVAKGIIDESPF